ncbi:MAG: hypothetical protein HSCHL_0525 [Hydrogenibacillus schlegelii]|uniref:Uncharacterized protein n=1 Tax=Hydrogenibacillus schlegelii TaxID=1484 RepID=A0A2T5GDH3_HYDSH|nr:tetratricopeptide repeat protein [Hydrogenibacillus schlegelii]PTQ54246.1 MAG: hypothetical protein HSCHL_0525 [Hydrogenibacillus schlegelii]
MGERPAPDALRAIRQALLAGDAPAAAGLAEALIEDAGTLDALVEAAALFTEYGLHDASLRLILGALGRQGLTFPPPYAASIRALPARAYYLLAQNFVNYGDFLHARLALDRMEAAFSRSPFEPDGDLQGFRAYLESEIRRTIHENTPREHIPALERAVLHYEAERYLQAAAAFRALLESAPDVRPAWRRLVQCYRRLDFVESAEATFQEALQRFPDDVELMADYAIFLHERGRRREARRFARRLRTILPLSLDVRYRLGLALGILGEDDRAYALLHGLFRRAPDEVHPGVLHYLAVAAYNTGRWEEARRFWRLLAGRTEGGWVGAAMLRYLDRAERRARKAAPARQGALSGPGGSPGAGAPKAPGRHRKRLSYRYPPDEAIFER